MYWIAAERGRGRETLQLLNAQAVWREGWTAYFITKVNIIFFLTF